MFYFEHFFLILSYVINVEGILGSELTFLLRQTKLNEVNYSLFQNIWCFLEKLFQNILFCKINVTFITFSLGYS